MRNISRRDFLKTAITAAAGAGGQRVVRAQGSSPQEPLRLLPSTPELEGWFDTSRLPWEPPDPDTATKISGILDELRREIPAAAPAAKRIAENIRVRIVKGGIDDKSLALHSTTLVEGKSKNVSFPADAGDYDHALMFLDLNRKALDIFSDRADLKAACAHELAHHILHLNPWLRDDPRFQPRSEEFTQEWNGITFTVRPEDMGPDVRQLPNDPVKIAARKEAKKRITGKR